MMRYESSPRFYSNARESDLQHYCQTVACSLALGFRQLALLVELGCDVDQAQRDASKEGRSVASGRKRGMMLEWA